jgi:hypothetical protein
MSRFSPILLSLIGILLFGACRQAQPGHTLLNRSLRSFVVLNEPANRDRRGVYSIQVMNEWMSDKGGALAYRFLTRSMTEADSNKAIDEALINLEDDLLVQGFKIVKTSGRSLENTSGVLWNISGHNVKADLLIRTLAESQGPLLKINYHINKG